MAKKLLFKIIVALILVTYVASLALPDDNDSDTSELERRAPRGSYPHSSKFRSGSGRSVDRNAIYHRVLPSNAGQRGYSSGSSSRGGWRSRRSESSGEIGSKFDSVMSKTHDLLLEMEDSLNELDKVAFQ